MESYLLDWANLLLRWVHVITAIAWVGSSFYFVFLDNNLIRPKSPDLLEKGVDGAMWAVHGGGFYNPQKYMVAPKVIHSKLHWFYWESYSTWLTGFALFTVLYLFNASTYLIDKSLMDWSPAAAIAVALGFLVGFWFIYDAVCRVFGFKENGEAIVGAVMLVVITAASWLACHWFAGRAAFLLVGAMIATAMSANVFFWIIPGQRKVVAAMTSGKEYDAKAMAIHGKRGKQRSVHNTYFTLPVIFAMLSNHYSFTYTHPQNWLVLVLMMLAGAGIRQYFVMRHAFHHGRAGNPWPYAAFGIVLIAGVILWLAPSAAPVASKSAATTAVASPPAVAGNAAVANVRTVSADISKIVEQRCLLCHGEKVQMKNIRLDSAELLQKNAVMVYQQVAITKQMPMGNSTGMTPEERKILGDWAKP
ncbi:MAG TPA: urate hydroxylase PuuD [Burkholderiaceae bacterium]|nr:urate hydroxylase PuuD [Burkholderiaceae bacterium]